MEHKCVLPATHLTILKKDWSLENICDASTKSYNAKIEKYKVIH